MNRRDLSPRYIIAVAYVEPVGCRGGRVGEGQLRRSARPLVAEPVQPRVIGVVAAVDVVECRYRDLVDALPVPQRQRTFVGEQVADVVHPVVEAHVAEEDRRVERLFLEAGFLDGDQPLMPPKKSSPVCGSVK